MKTIPFAKTLLMLAAILLPLSLGTHAAEPAASSEPSTQPEAESKPTTPSQDELIIKVDGAVCSFCANGLRKGLGKLDFVDTQQKGQGIRLDAKKQLLAVKLKKDTKADIKMVFDIIRKGGCKPVMAFTKGEDGKPVEHKPEPKK